MFAFCCEIYIHEILAFATSWNSQCMEKLIHQDVKLARIVMCVYGMAIDKRAAYKPKLMTNSMSVAIRLNEVQSNA